MADFFCLSIETTSTKQPNWDITVKPMYFFSQSSSSRFEMVSKTQTCCTWDFCMDDAIAMMEKVRLNDHHVAMYVKNLEIMLKCTPS